MLKNAQLKLPSNVIHIHDNFFIYIHLKAAQESVGGILLFLRIGNDFFVDDNPLTSVCLPQISLIFFTHSRDILR
jgi:hypothetical protein